MVRYTWTESVSVVKTSAFFQKVLFMPSIFLKSVKIRGYVLFPLFIFIYQPLFLFLLLFVFSTLLLLFLSLSAHKHKNKTSTHCAVKHENKGNVSSHWLWSTVHSEGIVLLVGSDFIISRLPVYAEMVMEMIDCTAWIVNLGLTIWSDGGCLNICTN